MLRFLKRKTHPTDSIPTSALETIIVQTAEFDAASAAAPPSSATPEEASDHAPGFFQRLKQKLQKTRSSLAEGLSNVFLGKKTIDNELYEAIETRLLSADVGMAATEYLMQDITATVKRKQLTDPNALFSALKMSLYHLLKPCECELIIPEQSTPFVILMVGVNGAGKTTTIGKIAKQLQAQGKSVMLAAGDTFRAAAIEQLQAWGERNDIPVIAQHSGADSASVIFDAFQSAKARHYDVLIADTAGRLHTQEALMAELHKIYQVLKKIDPIAPHEVLLTLDASIGQNALNQAQQFHKAVNVTGICLTKLDGTAKGGMIFAIAKDMKIPIKYIGVGESIDDLQHFNAEEFVEALFEPL